MKYSRTVLSEDLAIKKIITVHYFEFDKNYIFEGEAHNFWEFLYVDKGEVGIMADAKVYNLKHGEMIFHKPNEFHNVRAHGKAAPNLVVISFECKSEAMTFFENKIIPIGDHEKNLLAQIIRESLEAFSSPLNLSSLTKLVKKNNSHFGCEQLIKIYLEQLLISLVRKKVSITQESRISSAIKERSDMDIVKRIIGFLNDNVEKDLCLEDVCRFSNLSKTKLKNIFKERTGTGVIEYLRNLKIEAAKRFIREEQNNFTEIAEKLSYTSVQYFSRHFKQATGMTPSEYASLVKTKI